MRKISINGGNKLNGEIKISGAKNASLPILMSTVLIEDGESVISNIPAVSDIITTVDLLNHLGIKVEIDSSNLNNKIYKINAKTINTIEAPQNIVSKMRASFWILGSLVGRFGEAKVSLPGGCAIGERPCDIYIKALNQMQVDTVIKDGYVIAKSLKNNKPQGADITLRLPSVGATHNTIMAAVLAEGTTIIRNAAKEPEVIDLANFLIMSGADIAGAGTDIIKINGVKKLHSTQYKIICDRIEALSYIIASAITKSNLTIHCTDFSDILKTPIEILQKIGVNLNKIDKDTIKVISNDILNPVNIETGFYPGFPTDCQAPIMSLLGLANGVSCIDETIFENRLMHVPELNKLGANIEIVGNKAMITGVKKYIGTNIKATDLRAAMSMVLAGLSADGTTKISNIHHVERGYENLIGKLSNCGADIKIIEEEE